MKYNADFESWAFINLMIWENDLAIMLILKTGYKFKLYVL